MITPVNISHPLSYGEAIISEVTFAAKKLGLKVGACKEVGAVPVRDELLWIVALGQEYPFAPEFFRFANAQSGKLCVTVNWAHIPGNCVADLPSVVWTLIGATHPQQPTVPNAYFVGSTISLLKHETAAASSSTPMSVELLAGFRIAKILSSLCSGRALPIRGPTRRPHKAMVELVRKCNLSCPVCPAGNGTGVGYGNMPVAMFRNIVTFLAPTVWKLVLYNYGEPFLHRSLAECVKFAREQGIERVEISTNGNVVRAELPDLLVNSGLALLRFSIDGATQLTYERYRVGGNLQTVLNNMNSFRIARDRCGLREPVIEAQCVVNRYNELELGALCELVAAHGADRLRLKTFNALMSGSTFEELGRSFVPESKPLSRYDSPTTLLVRDEFKLSKCSWPSERIVINSNGDIVPCCYDPNGAHVLGQFRKLSMDWWETKEREAFRIRLEESAASIPMCQRCPIGVPDLRVRSNELLVEFSSI